MPLRRAVLQDAPNFTHPVRIRFPMTEDGGAVIWGEIKDEVLRRRAITDGIPGLEREALFDRYRNMLEALASEAFDEGSAAKAPDGAMVLHIDF